MRAKNDYEIFDILEYIGTINIEQAAYYYTHKSDSREQIEKR